MITKIISFRLGHFLTSSLDFELATDWSLDRFLMSYKLGHTGTMPFMALDHLLIREPRRIYETTPRLYQHDLESFCWVFLWICHCYNNGKEDIRYPFTKWIDCTPQSCYDAKVSLYTQMEPHLVTRSSKPFYDVLS